jgi:hypothetical protein
MNGAVARLARGGAEGYLPLVDKDPVIEVYKRHVDRTLLRENLKLTPEERLRNLMAAQRLLDELAAQHRRK